MLIWWLCCINGCNRVDIALISNPFNRVVINLAWFFYFIASLSFLAVLFPCTYTLISTIA